VRAQAIKREILGEESEDEGGEREAGSGDEDDEDDEDEDGDGAGGGAAAGGAAAAAGGPIRDFTETDLINLRRTIYLTIMSAMDFEEAGHKLLKIALADGQEVEVVTMLIECCSQEKTFLRRALTLTPGLEGPAPPGPWVPGAPGAAGGGAVGGERAGEPEAPCRAPCAAPRAPSAARPAHPGFPGRAPPRATDASRPRRRARRTRAAPRAGTTACWASASRCCTPSGRRCSRSASASSMRSSTAWRPTRCALRAAPAGMLLRSVLAPTPAHVCERAGYCTVTGQAAEWLGTCAL